jgi:hypothetical protein
MPGDEAHIASARAVYRMLCTVREVNRFFVLEAGSKNTRAARRGIIHAASFFLYMINMLAAGDFWLPQKL